MWTSRFETSQEIQCADITQRNETLRNAYAYSRAQSHETQCARIDTQCESNSARVTPNHTRNHSSRVCTTTFFSLSLFFLFAVLLFFIEVCSNNCLKLNSVVVAIYWYLYGLVLVGSYLGQGIGHYQPWLPVLLVVN